MNELRDKLKELGFERNIFQYHRVCYQFCLSRGDDRFRTLLFWYEDEPDLFYIKRRKPGGDMPISESTLMRNQFNLFPTSKEDYIDIIDDLHDAGFEIRGAQLWT